jgi:radical SAM protein with 4Fe4S-binding SPASM domain
MGAYTHMGARYASLAARLRWLHKCMRTVRMKRSYTYVKLRNALKVCVQHFFTQPTHVDTHPVRLIVDPTNHCQLSCPLCPTGQGRTERTRGVMPLDAFQRLLEEEGPYLFDIDFYCWGEPLLNPHLSQMVAQAHKKGIATSISTHLNHLTPQMAQDLVQAGLQQCVVSMDGTTQETYAVYRKGGVLEKVLRHTLLLQETKKRLGSQTPHIVWQFIAMQHNAHETAQAHRCYRRWGFDALEIKPVRCDMADEPLKTEAEKTQSAQPWMPSQETLQRYNPHTQKRHYAPKKCLFLWTQAVLHPNGSVSPCCATYHPQHDIANAFENGFAAAWNHKRYQQLREQVRTRNTQPHNPCASCIRHGFLEY